MALALRHIGTASQGGPISPIEVRAACSCGFASIHQYGMQQWRMRSAGLSEDPSVRLARNGSLPLACCCRCILDDACDVFQEGRAEATERLARFEVERLVELDTVIFVENDPTGKNEAGAPAFDLADCQKQTIVKRNL